MSALTSKVQADDVAATIRSILEEHGRLGVKAESLGLNDDLYSAGMTSHANVNVMLALEVKFDIEFPDEMLKRTTFESIASIRNAVTSLLTSA